MIKINCMFDSVDEAEYAKKKILSECSGTCRITNLPGSKSKDIFPLYSVPSNYGVNISPQTPADASIWQMLDPKLHEKTEKNNHIEKYRLFYIGFEPQAKKAESLLINIGASKINSSPYPHG